MSTQKDSVLFSHNYRMTKKITEIFRSSEKFILIEGAPGIGKTILAKEIAYCWANGEMLVGMTLFLLLMRDPDLHSVKSISDLVHYLGDDYLSENEVKAVADKLKNLKGSNVIFVIDGYDECPYDSNCKRLIDKLYKGELLTNSRVVITSRPTASLTLRLSVGQRIEILGLAKKEQDQYISESLKELSKIKDLQEYLKQQPIINSLVYVPLHLAILLYLFKQKRLPETLKEMNEYFIIHTIYRHLIKIKKNQIQFLYINKITDLPEPELTTIYQLAELAYKGLCKNQLIFTHDEFKKVCPNVNKIPGGLNGFGLLQAVKCYYQEGASAGETASLNFLHFTMQEYLAALHVSTLPTDQQSLWLKDTFHKSQFNFMWMMYIGIVGLQSSCFTDIVNSLHFDCTTISQSYLTSILLIFQCYLEAKNWRTIPEAITLIFSDGNINFSDVTLLPHHIISLIVFMMKSTTEWKSLDFTRCSIGCKGMSDLTKFFNDFKEKFATVKSIKLSSNDLTSLWGAHINMDKDDFTDTAILSVESLDLSCNKFNDIGIQEIFSALRCNKKLRRLNFCSNNLSINAITAISDCLKFNKTLHELNLSNNNITDEGVERLAQAIQENTILQELNVSKNLISKTGVMRILEACTKNKTLNKLVCTYNNLSKPGLTDIDNYIRKENAVQLFDASWNDIDFKYNQLVIKITFISRSHSLHYESWPINQITEPEYRREFLSGCLESEKSFELQHCHIMIADCFDIKCFSDCLKVNNTLIELTLSDVIITAEELQILVKGIEVNTALQNVDLSHNKISDNGTVFFSECLKINKTLHKLNLSGNNITDEGAKRLAEAIQLNTTLQVLNISENQISKEGIMRIVEACAQSRTLHKLVCMYNNLSKTELGAIVKYIKNEQVLQIFESSWNNVIKKDGKMTTEAVFHVLDFTTEFIIR